MNTQRRRIALLFHTNNGYFRSIAAAVAAQVRERSLPWELMIEELDQCQLDSIPSWNVDGIIAEFDDPSVPQALVHARARVVGMGSALPARCWPHPFPFAGADNAAMVHSAYTHLLDRGLHNFAMFSIPSNAARGWAREREHAFTLQAGANAPIHRGLDSSLSAWNDVMADLVAWLESLPKPVGIVAVCDARARLLLQACALTNFHVSSDIAIVGIDNDPVTRMLAELPLSSVMPPSEQIGQRVTELMEQQLEGGSDLASQVLLPPLGVNAMATCTPRTQRHPHVMRALHFIRTHAHTGIKSEQVADHVGVSRSWMEHHFKRDLGHTVHVEILRFKLEEAKRMLRQGASSMTEVALACGFTSVQYLYTVFARELGCTPRAWQERENKLARTQTV